MATLTFVRRRAFRGFQGAHGVGYLGLAATTWVPMGAQVLVLSTNDPPNPPQRQQKGFGKSQIFVDFQLTHASLELAENG